MFHRVTFHEEVTKVHKVSKVTREILARRVIEESKVQKQKLEDTKVIRVQEEIRVSLDHKVLDRRVTKVIKQDTETKDIEVFRVTEDTKVHKDLLDYMVKRDPRVIKVIKVHRVTLVLRELRV